ncbi:MAG: hypothetical protein D6772_02460, partial [Bacteroidetes bacterium]
PGMWQPEMLLMFVLLGLCLFFEYTRRHVDSRFILNFEQRWQRWLAYFILAFAIIALQMPEQKEFIYFEF